MRETLDLKVCTDCILLIANAEVIDGDGNDITAEHSTKMAATLGSLFELVLAGSSDDADTTFSYRPCEGCGSPLGGDRYDAAIFITV